MPSSVVVATGHRVWTACKGFWRRPSVSRRPPPASFIPPVCYQMVWLLPICLLTMRAHFTKKCFDSFRALCWPCWAACRRALILNIVSTLSLFPLPKRRCICLCHTTVVTLTRSRRPTGKKKNKSLLSGAVPVFKTSGPSFFFFFSSFSYRHTHPIEIIRDHGIDNFTSSFSSIRHSTFRHGTLAIIRSSFKFLKNKRRRQESRLMDGLCDHYFLSTFCLTKQSSHSIRSLNKGSHILSWNLILKVFSSKRKDSPRPWINKQIAQADNKEVS